MSESVPSADKDAGLSATVLRELPEGAVIITAGVAWAKIGPDEWRCPFREHVPDMSISPRWRGVFRWHDEKNSEWLAEVATRVVYDPRILPPAPNAAERFPAFAAVTHHMLDSRPLPPGASA